MKKKMEKDNKSRREKVQSIIGKKCIFFNVKWKNQIQSTHTNNYKLYLSFIFNLL